MVEHTKERSMAATFALSLQKAYLRLQILQLHRTQTELVTHSNLKQDKIKKKD